MHTGKRPDALIMHTHNNCTTTTTTTTKLLLLLLLLIISRRQKKTASASKAQLSGITDGYNAARNRYGHTGEPPLSEEQARSARASFQLTCLAHRVVCVCSCRFACYLTTLWLWYRVYMALSALLIWHAHPAADPHALHGRHRHGRPGSGSGEVDLTPQRNITSYNTT